MLDSMYEEYLKERLGDLTVKSDFGFATYRYLEDRKAVYIVDIFVRHQYRKDGHASMLADKIGKEAKAKGYPQMIGTVVPSTKGSTESLKALLAYGMTLESATNDLIIFKKDF